MKLWVLFESPYSKIAGIYDSFEGAKESAEKSAVLLGKDTNPEWQSYGDIYFTYDEHGPEWSQGIFELRSFDLNALTSDIIEKINDYQLKQANSKDESKDY